MSVEIAWEQNILFTDFHLLKSLLVVFGFGSKAFVCGFSRQNINSVQVRLNNKKFYLRTDFNPLWLLCCCFLYFFGSKGSIDKVLVAPLIVLENSKAWSPTNNYITAHLDLSSPGTRLLEWRKSNVITDT